MKKVFVFPTHCDGKHVPGVDYVRVVRPMEELAKHPDFDVRIYNGEGDLDWREIAQEYDILYLNYVTNAAGFVVAAFPFNKFGKKIVFDIDDLIWDIQEDNAAYKVYAPGSEGRAVVTDIVARGADAVTCTNDFLRKGIADATDAELSKIKVLKNYIVHRGGR